MSVLASVTTHRELVTNLVLRDVRSRYKQSALGYLWAVFNPFVLALVYSLVMRFMHAKGDVGGVPLIVYSFYGVLFFNLFATGVASATEGLVSHVSLLTKVYFPREVFPVSAVVSKLVDFALGLGGLVALLVLFRLVPSWETILVVPLLAVLLLLMMGIGMLCACANLFYRDIRYLVQLAINLLAYFVPNIYTLNQVHEYAQSSGHPWVETLYLMNPLATLIEAMRRATFPQTGSLGELTPYIAWACGVAVALFAIGFCAFKAQEPRFAEFV